MKNKNPLLLPLVAAMLPALPANATVPENYVTVNAKVSYQKNTLFSTQTARADVGTIRGQLGTLRINTKELLKVIAEDLNLTLPKGARFLHVNNTFLVAGAEAGTKGSLGGMWIVDKQGFPISNVSNYFNIEFDLGSLIWEGTYNPSTDRERSTNRFPFSILFNYFINGGIQPRGIDESMGVFLEGTGVVRENFQSSSRNGTYRASDNGVGDGYVTGTVANNFRKGEFGINAMGYFNFRFNGSEVNSFED